VASFASRVGDPGKAFLGQIAAGTAGSRNTGEIGEALHGDFLRDPMKYHTTNRKNDIISID
jgi:hypothetical protein